MKKNLVIIILGVLVLGMGGYLVYDKVLDKDVKEESKEEKLKNNDSSKEEKIEQKDAEYFNEYLEAFMSCDGEYVSRNTDNFTNKDISNFVASYYQIKALEEDSQKNIDSSYTYSVTVKELDELVKRYFNVEKYEIVDTNFAKITKKTENTYIFEWGAVGCGYVQYKNPVVNYDGTNVTVKYELYNIMEDKYTGKYSTFYLKYNNDNYNIVKIEE